MSNIPSKPNRKINSMSKPGPSNQLPRTALSGCSLFGAPLTVPALKGREVISSMPPRSLTSSIIVSSNVPSALSGASPTVPAALGVNAEADNMSNAAVSASATAVVEFSDEDFF